MIISHKHRFIFIKTVKTASTSIEVYLARHCGGQDIVTPIKPPVDGHIPRNYDGFVNHMAAASVRERLPSATWNSYFKFCVERNPWDKVLSHFHMQQARAPQPLSFDAYLRAGKFPINYPRYTDDGNVIVDRILRYERLNEELSNVVARLGVPFSGTLDVYAKSEYRDDRRPYQQAFNEEQRKIVEEAFAKEIELHGYRFESPA